ncbi:MAG: hypothetical protein ACE5GV_00420 [Candidatus Scalindua sp.]
MADLTLIITIGATGASFIISMIMMLLWSRSEAREDYRHLEAGIREMRNEMKDFHGRLCKIEEARNQEIFKLIKLKK